MASVLIYISSDDRTAESKSTSDFTVSYGNNNKLTRIRNFYVKSLSIPNVSNNVYHSSDVNSVPENHIFTYSSGSITLPEGFYNMTQLIAAITADALAIADGMSITVNPLTGFLTFTTTSPVSFYNLADGNSMATLLGIKTSSVAPALTFTTTNLPDLSGVNNVFVSSLALSGNSMRMIQKKTNKPYIIDVPINEVAHGFYLNYETQHFELDEVSANSYFNLDAIDIQLYDPLGRIIDLHGLQFNMTIRAFYDP
ncbi:MAG: hypothetical protein V4589_05575 [Bacteroidota bacterium]